MEKGKYKWKDQFEVFSEDRGERTVSELRLYSKNKNQHFFEA